MKALYQCLLRRVCWWPAVVQHGLIVTVFVTHLTNLTSATQDIRSAVPPCLRSTCLTRRVHDWELTRCAWRLCTAPVQRFVCKDWLYTLANRALGKSARWQGGGANPRNPFTGIPWGHRSRFYENILRRYWGVWNIRNAIFQYCILLLLAWVLHRVCVNN